MKCQEICSISLLHAVQDVAIAYGYNNLAWTVPQPVTIGSELPLNALSEALRAECAMAGYAPVGPTALLKS